MNPLLLVQLASTLCLVGLIWTIQIVHYPLMAQVGVEEFTRYHAAHSAAITWLVVPLMLAELVSAIALVLDRPEAVPNWAAWVGLALVVLIWLSTGLLQVPQHALLAQGFDAGAHRTLVLSNWVRTAAWSLRGLLLLWLVARS